MLCGGQEGIRAPASEYNGVLSVCPVTHECRYVHWQTDDKEKNPVASATAQTVGVVRLA